MTSPHTSGLDIYEKYGVELEDRKAGTLFLHVLWQRPRDLSHPALTSRSWGGCYWRTIGVMQMCSICKSCTEIKQLEKLIVWIQQSGQKTTFSLPCQLIHRPLQRNISSLFVMLFKQIFKLKLRLNWPSVEICGLLETQDQHISDFQILNAYIAIFCHKSQDFNVCIVSTNFKYL